MEKNYNNNESSKLQKKIAFISPLDLNLYLFRLPWINALKDAGLDVCCILPKYDDTKKVKDAGYWVEYYRLARYSFNPFQGLLTIYDLYCIFRKEHFCVVHTFTIKPNIYGAIAAKLTGIPIIVSQVTGVGYIYTSDTLKAKFLKLFSDLFYRLIFKIATRIIFQNHNDLEDMRRLLDPKKVVIIKGSGVNTQYYSNLNIDKEKVNDLRNQLRVSGRIVVTLIARLYWGKGIKEFIDAAKLIHAKFDSVLFLIIGWQDKGGPEVISDKFIESQSCEFIRFLGKTEYVRDLLSITDIYVLPSYREGSPNSILEAMSMGKPVVTTMVPGCMDVVTEGVNGLLVPPKDSRRLAEAIMQLISGESLRSKFGNAGREMVLKSFSTEIILKEVLKLYEDLILGIKYKDGLLIRKANLADCTAIARIHIRCLPKSFIGSLGVRVLTLLYKELLKYQKGIILICEYNSSPCGFVTGVMNSKDFSNYFLKKNFIKLITILFPSLFSLSVLKRILEDIAYSNKKWNGLVPDAELLSMAVDTDYRKKGIGKRLFENLIHEFSLVNIKEFKILVGSRINGAGDFYEKLGCKNVHSFKFHNNMKSDVYVFKNE